MEPSAAFRPEELLQHRAFLCRLARGLLGDASRAEDVVQEAFALALARPPREPRSLSVWLGQVVRRLSLNELRGARRSLQRERAVARPEATASHVEAALNLDTQHVVLSAVRALEEPYRTTIWLRYYEDLAPSVIAERQEIPVKTVKTRLARGLERLRAELDRASGGDRKAWSALLVRLSRSSTPFASPAHLTPLGLLAMTLQTKLAVGVAILAVAAVLLWTQRGSGPVQPGEARVEPTSALVQPEVGHAPELRAPAATPERVALAAQERQEQHVTAEPSGSLLVRVTWSDKTPAAGIQARVEPAWSSGDPSWQALEAVTDAAGEFRLEHIALGNALVMLDRGDSGGAVAIENGREATAEIELERGFDVAGVVRDPIGNAVSDADIWLSTPHSSAQGFVVARSGADGRFLVRACGGGAIGARAARFAPSLLQTVRATEGAQLELVLVLMGPGGELTGTVFDPEGNPVPSAWVMAGEREPWQVSAVPVGGVLALTGLRPFGQEVRTDTEGHYRVRGLAPGACPIAVRAAGFGLARGTAEIIEHASATFDVHLTLGVTLEGRVVDRAGQPLEAEVFVGRQDVLGSQTTTDADGVFRLADLEPGELEVLVESQRKDRSRAAGPRPYRRARTTLHGASGETLRWDVALSDGGSIRGRLVDEHGAGLAGWFIQVEDEAPLAADYCGTVGLCKTDATGRFVAEGLGDHRHRLEAHPLGPVLFSAAVATGVFPEREDVLLRVDPARLPSVHIVGAVLDENGQAVPGAQLRLTNPAFARSAGASPGIDGSFDLGPYPSGAWSLRVMASERADRPELLLGPHELAAGETWDCGAITLQPGGTLRVHTTGDTSAAPALLVLQASVWRGKLHAEGAAWRSDPLAPGVYRLAVHGPSVVAALVPFTIRAGETTELEVPLAVGPPLEVRLLAEAAGPYQKPVLRIRAASGAIVVEEELWFQKSGDYHLELALAPGSYHVEAWRNELRAEAELVVEADTAPAPLVFALH